MLNSFAPIDPKLIDVVIPEDGYPVAFEAEDTTDALKDVCGAAARDFPEKLWIEFGKWAEKAKENDENHTHAMNYIDRYTMQDPTHECTCHSLVTNFGSCRNRQRGVIYVDGPKKDHRYAESGKAGSVWLSPLSVYSEANPRKSGGANVRQVMEIAVKRGILPDTIQPHDYGFKHTLVGTSGKGNSNQSGGKWVAVKDFPEGWQETAKLFRPLEVIFPESWEQAVCLVLHGYVVSVGRKGHAVPWSQWNHKEQVMAYPDSYNITRYDSLATVKSAWQGAFAIATVTAPDDWSKPAQ